MTPDSATLESMQDFDDDQQVKDPPLRAIWEWHGGDGSYLRVGLSYDWRLILTDGTPGRSFDSHVYSREWRPGRTKYATITLSLEAREWFHGTPLVEALSRADRISGSTGADV